MDKGFIKKKHAYKLTLTYQVPESVQSCVLFHIELNLFRTLLLFRLAVSTPGTTGLDVSLFSWSATRFDLRMYSVHLAHAGQFSECHLLFKL